MTLRRRLALLTALAVALAIALASVIVYALVRDQLTDQIDDTLRERADAARLVVGGRPIPIGEGPPPLPPPGIGPGPGPPGPPPQTFELPGPPPGGADFVARGQLIDRNGTVLQAREGALPVSAEAREVAAGERGEFFADVDAGESQLRVLTVPAAEGEALQVARPLDEVNDTLDDLVVILVLVSIGGVVLAAGLGYLVSRTAVAPAAELAGAAQEVAQTSDLTRRIDVRGSDELGRMAASFNEMMAALERSVGAQRRLVADASHELRTPLATLRTNIATLTHGDGLSDEEHRRLLDDLDAEMEELSGLVGDVVELARDPSEGEMVTEEVRLDELAAAAVARARRRARGLRFSEELEPSLVRGDPARLDRAIGNLLDNAVKWSPEGGEVVVTVADGRLAIRDHGPGFADEDLPHAFERFYRSDDARGTPGSGLGLAIVERIAEQHGGSASAANAEGGGAVVEIRLAATALSDS